MNKISDPKLIQKIINHGYEGGKPALNEIDDANYRGTQFLLQTHSPGSEILPLLTREIK
ncbi:MAG: hypothetical protein AAGM12_10130 [Pseudomonadota bacterium]